MNCELHSISLSQLRISLIEQVVPIILRESRDADDRYTKSQDSSYELDIVEASVRVNLRLNTFGVRSCILSCSRSFRSQFDTPPRRSIENKAHVSRCHNKKRPRKISTSSIYFKNQSTPKIKSQFSFGHRASVEMSVLSSLLIKYNCKLYSSV